MRRALLTALLPTITTVAALIPAGAARASSGRMQVKDPLNSGSTNGSITLPRNRCGFPVDIAVVKNNEYETLTTLADGTTITNIRGNLVLSFTNDSSPTRYTIVRNVSGPTTETDHFDQQGNFVGGTFVGRGENWFGFGPVSQGNTGEPGLVFTSGLVTLGLGTSGVTSFSLDGSQINGCALLAQG